MTKQQEIKEFLSWLRRNQESILLVLHEQADLDAVGSAIALIHMIKYINPQLEVTVHNPDLSQLSKQLLLHLDYEFTENAQINSSTPLILLDNPAIPSDLNQPDRKIVIIDHHVKQEIRADLLFDIRTQKVTSTAEIISQIYRIANIPLNAISVKAIIAGIIFDTRRFLHANSQLFDNMSYLLQTYPDAYNEILPLFSSTRPSAERIACIKASQRMTRAEVGNFQVLLSHVSSYEAAAARSLIYLGGDLSVVVARRSDHTRLSLRATSDFIKATDISLGRDIIPLLIKEFGGSGGGHDGAAGYNNSNRMDLKTLFDYILKNLVKIFKENKQNKNIQV
ncbi:MAG: DHH family phosphoesterase [Candidatus Hodarchaeales archaeon]|jgi:nanoRNase/pAp phosphatase (c-di-AMP/oligoRNAs hydrolase)